MNNNVIIFNNIKSLELRYKKLNEQVKEINNSLKNDLITNIVESNNIVCNKSISINDNTLFIDEFKNLNIGENTFYIDNHRNININDGLMYLDKNRNININNKDIYINNEIQETSINHNLNIKNNLIYIDNNINIKNKLIYIDDNININNEQLYINNSSSSDKQVDINCIVKINENPLIFEQHYSENENENNYSKVRFDVVNKNGKVYLKISSSINDDYSNEKVCYIDITSANIISSI